MQETQAYPLHWPPGRSRTKFRGSAVFHRKTEQTWRRADGSTYTTTKNDRLTIADSRDRVMKELSMMGAKGIVISSNLELRMDGAPRTNQREPSDPGIAVYFTLNNQPHCLSCDRWNRAADNLAAIAKYVEAMRGQIRWGVGDVASMFAGFKALPNAVVTAPTMTVDEARDWIKCAAGFAAISDENLQDAFRICAKKFHPDANGGQTPADWHVFQAAKQTIEQAA